MAVSCWFVFERHLRLHAIALWLSLSLLFRLIANQVFPVTDSSCFAPASQFDQLWQLFSHSKIICRSVWIAVSASSASSPSPTAYISFESTTVDARSTSVLSEALLWKSASQDTLGEDCTSPCDSKTRGEFYTRKWLLIVCYRTWNNLIPANSIQELPVWFAFAC